MLILDRVRTTVIDNILSCLSLIGGHCLWGTFCNFVHTDYVLCSVEGFGWILRQQISTNVHERKIACWRFFIRCKWSRKWRKFYSTDIQRINMRTKICNLSFFYFQLRKKQGELVQKESVIKHMHSYMPCFSFNSI